MTVNDVISDNNVITKIMNNSTGLQCIELNGLPNVIGKLVINPLHMVGVWACAEAQACTSCLQVWGINKVNVIYIFTKIFQMT